MNLEKSLQRFAWRFSNGKFEPNKNDVEALNFLVDWVNREKTKQLRENILFAKMFLELFGQELQYNDISFKLAQKKLSEHLKMPLEQHYDLFTKKLNRLEMQKFERSLGLTPHLNARTTEEQQRDSEIISKNQEELMKYLNGIWDEDKIYQSLNNNITEFCNRFKNLP